MTTSVLVALGTWWVAARAGRGRPWLSATVAGAAVALPVSGLAIGAVVVARLRWKRARSVGAEESRAEGDVTLLADLVLLGVTAGLSLRASIERAAARVHPVVQRDVEDLIRRIDRDGSAAGLAATTGRLEGLARVAAGAAITGAPVSGALTGFAASRRHDDHMARLEAARRLPVRLLLPLALLILPGFVVLAVGPAVLEGLARLGSIP
jgi:tight adherence protein C